MKSELEQIISSVVQSTFGVTVPIVLNRPEEQFGDYATNVALQLAGQLQDNPRAIAERLVEALRNHDNDDIADITIAGPGFINIKMSDSALRRALDVQPGKSLAGKTIVAEYSDPNPFKVLHAGHLYTTIVGNAVSNLLEQAGGTVHRVNFGGDVGLHVGKSMWGILKFASHDALDEAAARTQIEQLADRTLDERAAFMADRYVEGNEAYETDEAAKQQIIEVNRRVYEIHAANDHESDFAVIYWTCRNWSYDYFNLFYERLGITPFEKYMPESETADIGIATVKEQLAAGVYEESDGAVIFRGEPYGLHTRVFINSNGLPTYEAKDVGLIMKKWREYAFDLSVIITGNDIVEYMKVVLKSIEQFMPELPPRTKHITHGQIKLTGGVKMSSRLGNVLIATDVLDAARQAAQKVNPEASDQVSNAAVKYAFIKQRTGGDIIYDPEESVSVEGNSGPYLQYAHARARSILAKVPDFQASDDMNDFDEAERSFVRKLTEYPEVVDRAVAELMPHHVATYLYELAQTFNRFYEHSRVIGDERQNVRLNLVHYYADCLKRGLSLLGIVAPEHM